MEFTKVGRYHLRMDDIVFVLDEGVGARISVGFRGGGTALLSEQESRALRVWLADKVKEELSLKTEEESRATDSSLQQAKERKQARTPIVSGPPAGSPDDLASTG